MTDAALPVTEQAVSEFVTGYFDSLDATIHKEGGRWEVSIPKDANTELSLNETVVQLVTHPEEADNDAVALTPGSDRFEQIVDDAVTHAPIGSLALTGDDVNFDDPDYVVGESTEVTNQQFTPYYDRHALCVLFDVGVETVSEYQCEMLKIGAVDLADHESRPQLAQTCLKYLEQTSPRPSESNHRLTDGELTEAIAACREMVRVEIDSNIEDIREKATRAASVEIEEYRQYLQQRRDELKAEKQQLSEQIDELSTAIDAASERTDRLKRLRERKQLRDELADLRDELDGVRDSLNQGMPQKRAEIQDRHALTVRIRPVTATIVTHERGELDLSVRTDDCSATLTCDYAVGIGTLSRPTCDQCGTALDSQNPVEISPLKTTGRQCCGQ